MLDFDRERERESTKEQKMGNWVSTHTLHCLKAMKRPIIKLPNTQIILGVSMCIRQASCHSLSSDRFQSSCWFYREDQKWGGIGRNTQRWTNTNTHETGAEVKIWKFLTTYTIIQVNLCPLLSDSNKNFELLLAILTNQVENRACSIDPFEDYPRIFNHELNCGQKNCDSLC